MIMSGLEIGVIMMISGTVLGLCGLIFERLFAGFNIGAVICFAGFIIVFAAIFIR